jgi:hypothetical protein
MPSWESLRASLAVLQLHPDKAKVADLRHGREGEVSVTTDPSAPLWRPVS